MQATFRKLLFGALFAIAPAAALAMPILYGSNGNGGPDPGLLVTIDQSTGDGTPIADPITPGGLSGIVFGAGGVLYGSTITGGSTSRLVILDPVTGALLSTVGPMGISVGDLAYDPVTGILYGIRSNASGLGGGGELYTIDTTTGAATFVGDTGSAAGGGIAFTSTGQLYQTAYNSGSDFTSLNEIDPTDASRISTVRLDAYFDGLAIRPTDGVIFAARGGSVDGIYTISTSGTTTFLGATGTGGISDLAFTQEQRVPEPATLALFATALAGLAAGRRRQRGTRGNGTRV